MYADCASSVHWDRIQVALRGYVWIGVSGQVWLVPWQFKCHQFFACPAFIFYDLTACVTVNAHESQYPVFVILFKCGVSLEIRSVL